MEERKKEKMKKSEDAIVKCSVIVVVKGSGLPIPCSTKAES